MANFCPKCGKKTAPTDVYCGACYEPLPGDDRDYGESANPYAADAPSANPYVDDAPSANPYVDNAPSANPCAADAPSANPFVTDVPGANSRVADVDADATVGPSFGDAFAYCIKHCFETEGRATRTEWWGCAVVVLPLVVIALFQAGERFGLSLFLVFLVSGLLSSVTYRRRNDIGAPPKRRIKVISLILGGVISVVIGAAIELQSSFIFINVVDVALCVLSVFIYASLIGLPLSYFVYKVISPLLLIAFCPGTKGPNKYGPRRLNPSDVKR
ncbi:MAG: DUF805 domain-containing protein [Thermoguttaceae bacterium]|nr:DUF805 domain-containing protein [Thermoguttaceae bacterium]